MLDARFSGSSKDFSPYIQLLRSLRVQPGSSLLDFGASWGYGVWQFSQSGYLTQGFELSKPRAQFARLKLNVDVVDSDSDLPSAYFDCFFSRHVLEHLSSPSVAFRLACRVLKPCGLFVAVVPNGSEACRIANASLYDHSWGRQHPLYLSAEFIQNAFPDHPYLLTSSTYGIPFDAKECSTWSHESQEVHDLSGRELLIVVRF